MRRVGGFTLMELLLVLGLFAAMAALSLPVVRYLQLQARQVRAQAHVVESERAAWYWLRQSLGRAEASAMAVDPASGRDVLWQTTASSLQWRGRLPAGLPQRGVFVQRLQIETRESGVALTYRVANASQDEAANGNETLLLDGLSRAEFAYRRIEANGLVSEWLTEWPDATQMPVQVRVRILKKRRVAPLEAIIALPQSSALSINRIDAGAVP